ncbi:polysaccharide deacetylase family protein [Prauserella flavalba]|uniref:Polysaccharide deacetylase n=1 Tax=Prauserella flavalba TaxID=1477506 RepID=A0A318LMX5_9PSEU|nr:polysaccharide deacetylase family protein [Prauserella flavalba]PXY35823.1 polysaccharide deacetylase [Prauserella flavalba]
MRHRVLRPPYCYRWAVLILTLVTVTTFAVAALRTSSAVGAPTAANPLGHATSTPARATPPPVAAEVVRHTDRPGRVVALTFDDGPDPVYTPRILDLLSEHDAVATFCMLGSEARRHPELVQQVLARGMRLCDHTVSHDQDLRTRSEQRITAEVMGGWTDLQIAAGRDVPVPYFRAPAGNWSERTSAVAARNGMRSLAWSVDSRDWTLPGTERIVAAVKEGVEPGAVVLLHDGGGQREQTVAALAELLPWLLAQGYELGFP